MKIKNDSVVIGTDNYFYEVHYNVKEGFFFAKNLPNDFEQFSPLWKEQKTFESESQLRSQIILARDEYVENKAVSRKVIVFSASASSEVIQNRVIVGESHTQGVSRVTYEGFKHPNFKKLGNRNFNEKDYAIGFSFFVMTEVDKVGSKEYFKHELDANFKETGFVDRYPKLSNQHFIKNDYTVIEYSEASLMFFIQLSEGFTKMAQQMAMFFGEPDKQKQLEFIKNQKLLK